MLKLEEKYMDILQENDWSVSSYLDDGRVKLEKYSPAGEDFSVCVEVENFPESVREYANDFDPDEHAKVWIEAREKVRGVPDSIRELIEDVEAIQEMLNDLADSLNGIKNNSRNITKVFNSSELAKRICHCITEYKNKKHAENIEMSLYNELSQLPITSSIKESFNALCLKIETLEEREKYE